MAITYTFAYDETQANIAVGGRHVKRGTLTLTGTATAGGDAVTADLFGLSTLLDLNFRDAITSAGHVPRFTPADLKVLLYETGAAAEGALQVLDGAETATGTIRVEAQGY